MYKAHHVDREVLGRQLCQLSMVRAVESKAERRGDQKTSGNQDVCFPALGDPSLGVSSTRSSFEKVPMPTRPCSRHFQAGLVAA